MAPDGTKHLMIIFRERVRLFEQLFRFWIHMLVV
jgi:hypothetical protein